MKKVGRGWQFVVYDIGNGRVRKQTYSPIAQYLKILFTNIPKNWNIFRETYRAMKRANHIAQISHAYVQSIVSKLDPEIIGNPTFLQAGYEQDKVIILAEIIQKSSLDDGKKIIDAYIGLIHTLWKFGCADSVFNFHINNGLNKKGEVIQIDFGELELSKEKIEYALHTKRWLSAASYMFFLKGDLKRYFKEQMEKELTIEKYNRFWKTGL